jgi:hypothetical protein
LHGIVALFLGVIALVIILLVIGFVALCVLVVVSTMIVASILLMRIVRLVIDAIVFVTLMVIAVLVTALMTVAQFTATRGRKMGRFPFLQLLLVLGNLLKNDSYLVGCLTLLKESNHPERVSRHCLVQVSKLVLVCLSLREEVCSLFSCAVGRSIIQQR